MSSALGLGLLLSGVADGAAAAEWWFVASSKDTSHFVDRESVREINVSGRRLYRAWIADYNSTVKDGWKSQKVLAYVDCADLSVADKSYIEYRANGDVGRTNTFSDYSLSWNPTAPGTIGESKLLFICNASLGAGETTSFDVDGITFSYVESLEEGARRLTPKPVPPRPIPKAPLPKVPPRK